MPSDGRGLSLAVGAAAAALAVVALLWWAAEHGDSEEGARAAAPAAAASTALAASSPTQAVASGVRGGAPLSAAGLQARRAQLALWQERLERAQHALEAYTATTRYPHGSRPASEQPDQMRPNDPIVEDHPLREPGKKTAEGVRLRTTQERIFLQGDESVRFTIALVDAAGAPLPLRVLRVSAREVPPPRAASLYPVVPVEFNDDGTGADGMAGDRVFSARLQPSTQGFAQLAGQIRVEVFLEYRGEQGFTYFDLYVTPTPPATWNGGAREALEDGSLNFYLRAQVREPGRYVVTGRVDDANGQPYALLTFNDEVAAGGFEFRLTLFGKLVRDVPPAFPLTLRDVEAFRLREEGHPDRALMPRLSGRVLTTARHAITAFSDAAWSSEERTRYLAELTRDVDEAQKKVDQLKGP